MNLGSYFPYSSSQLLTDSQSSFDVMVFVSRSELWTQRPWMLPIVAPAHCGPWLLGAGQGEQVWLVRRARSGEWSGVETEEEACFLSSSSRSPGRELSINPSNWGEGGGRGLTPEQASERWGVKFILCQQPGAWTTMLSSLGATQR